MTLNNIVPIPEIVKHGKYNDIIYYAISSKCFGITHDKLSSDEAKKLLPELITTVEKLRLVDVSDTKGYGLTNADGVGVNDNWSLALTSMYNHKFPDIDIKKLFDDSILDRTYFGERFKRLFNLLSFIPEEKYLVHGDFGFDNLVVNNNHVTGILDWAEARYGDFLYDIAWLDFWSNDIEYVQEFKKYYAQNKVNINDFDERIECYRLHIGLNSLVLAAYLNNEQDYEKIANRIEKKEVTDILI